MPKEPNIHRDDKGEEATIGACLCAPEACEVAIEMLKPSDFFVPAYRTAFESIKELYNSGKTVDEITVGTLCKEKFKDFDLDVLGRCVVRVPSAAGVESYSEGVRSASLARALGSFALRIQGDLERGAKSEEILAFISKESDRINSRLAGVEDEPESIHQISKAIVKDLGPARRISGLACGLGDGILDALLDGWERPSYVVLAARTSLGKSTTALAIARGIVQQNPDAGFPLIISTEMSKQALARKDLACIAGLGSRDIKRGNLDRFQRKKLQETLEKSSGGLYVASMAGATLEQVRAVAKRHQRKYGLPMLLVDLAQQLGSPLREKDMTAHCGYISNGLFKLALELNTCVLACVQINRSAVTGSVGMGSERGKPEIHHLKNSGSWEEDADKIILLHRPAYYGESDKRTEFILAKDRSSGETGSCFLTYDKATGRFVDSTVRDEK